jgi:hypothetical protein
VIVTTKVLELSLSTEVKTMYIVFGIPVCKGVDDTVIVGWSADKETAKRVHHECQSRVPQMYKYFVAPAEELIGAARQVDDLVKYSAQVSPYKNVNDLWIFRVIAIGGAIGLVWAVVMLILH